MINTIFDYWVSDSECILVKASAKSLDKWAEDLRIVLPKNFIVKQQVYNDIEKHAVLKLKEEVSE